MSEEIVNDIKLQRELEELLGKYFDVGVLEGREHRNHDTPDGAAQKALHAIRIYVRRMIKEERVAAMGGHKIKPTAGPVTMWKGRPIDDLPREELLVIVEWCGREINRLQQTLISRLGEK